MPDSISVFDPLTCTREELISRILIVKNIEKVAKWNCRTTTLKLVVGITNPHECTTEELRILLVISKHTTLEHDARFDPKRRIDNLVIVKRAGGDFWEVYCVTHPRKIQHLPDLDAVRSFLETLYLQEAEPSH